jgi:hypothetical protein
MDIYKYCGWGKIIIADLILNQFGSAFCTEQTELSSSLLLEGKGGGALNIEKQKMRALSHFYDANEDPWSAVITMSRWRQCLHW